MFNKLFLLAIASGVFAIKCNNAITPSTLPITILDSSFLNSSSTDYSCVSFTFTCSLENTVCSPDQQSKLTLLSGYTMIETSICSNLSANIPTIVGVPVCCTTDLCNAVSLAVTGTNSNNTVGAANGGDYGSSSRSNQAGFLVYVAIGFAVSLMKMI